MIQLTRINHAQMVLNSDLIEQIQAAPDTVITLTNGQNLRVLETPEEIVDLVVTFRRRLFQNLIPSPPPASSSQSQTAMSSDKTRQQKGSLIRYGQKQ